MAWVYILASQKRGTLYIGVTSTLSLRIHLHKTEHFGGFTKQYNVKILVYTEEHETISQAIQREKSLKRWYRKWKVDLIESVNPEWNDLYEMLNW